MSKKVLVGMSGGVDSSVAAALLINDGYNVAGATMIMWDKSYNAEVEDAKNICDKLGIKHYVIDCTKEFKEKVIDNFINDYAQGRTPNPCIMCNKHIKFGLFLNKAQQMGYDYIATGHYAVIDYDVNYGYVLKKSIFEDKDQSYVLYNIANENLHKIIFPIGKYKKDNIRQIAKKYNLSVFNKSDSQDICFIPDGDYVSFLELHLNQKPKSGNFINEYGEVYGKHNGIWNYTIGQRRGLGMSFKTRMFVTDIDCKSGNITISDNDPQKDRLIARDVNFILPNVIKNGLEVEAKIRYKHKPKCAKIFLQDDNTVMVIFRNSQRAITPGQSVVFYSNDIVLGGGIIR